MFKKQIATLLETEMDRKSFLKTAAITGIALTGVVTAFKTITAQIPTSSPKTIANTQSSAYGVALYGKPQAGWCSLSLPQRQDKTLALTHSLRYNYLTIT